MSRLAVAIVAPLLSGSILTTASAAFAADVPWLAEVQLAPAPSPSAAAELSPLWTPAGEPLTHKVWETRRDQLRREWLDFLGPLSRTRLAQGPAPPTVEILAVEVVDGVRRELLRYEVEPGQPVEAYRLRPEQLSAPAPGIVVFHSTVAESLRQPAGVEGAPEKAFGWRLARLGCVTLCPRNYLWPENRRLDAAGEAARFLQRQPASKGMDRMLLDGLAAVDLLAADPLVDPRRIGCIGHSLGAKEALYLAAFDDRVRATVSSEGGIGIHFSNWNAAWYLGPDVDRPDFPREHHELLALAAPRAFLLVGGDSADGDRSWPFVAAALPVYQLADPTPRLGLYNHRQGHTVPPEALARMLEWLTTYLADEPSS